MKTLKRILLSTMCIVLFTTCKRNCTDERADNFEDGHRKENCDFGNADNWNKEIIVDSILINGTRIELVDESWRYEPNAAYTSQTEKGWEYMMPSSAQNTYSSRFDREVYLSDTLNSISFHVGIPVATNYETNVRALEFEVFYIDTVQNNGENYSRNDEVFTFVEERNINGVVYYFYDVLVTDIQNDALIGSNFSFSTIDIRIAYEVYFVSYNIIIDNIL